MNTEGSFPVKPIRTNENWNNLRMGRSTQEQVNEVKSWLQHNTSSRTPDGGDRVGNGFRALFAGSPASGKAAAALLAQEAGREVFHISLSKVISKYVGETEKNLDTLFSQAAEHNWILFFDDADALFDRRTVTTDTQDSHTAQESVYLLQKIESYGGLVILATGREHHLNDVVLGKLNTVVNFEPQLQA
ncbi:AAA family ATPase [Deminuibacter soli]|nr:ATP-binding protein [Deminuibacter soli]